MQFRSWRKSPQTPREPAIKRISFVLNAFLNVDVYEYASSFVYSLVCSSILDTIMRRRQKNKRQTREWIFQMGKTNKQTNASNFAVKSITQILNGLLEIEGLIRKTKETVVCQTGFPAGFLFYEWLYLKTLLPH